MSVGAVMKQTSHTAKRKQWSSLSSKDFYVECLKDAPGVVRLLGEATLTSDLKSASDWSYSASSYASRNLRLVGDAGCFIDPLFSSGMHLAMASGLSAAVTICAARRGDFSEKQAAEWHTKKVHEGYSRFLVVVTSSLEQILSREDHILNESNEHGFDRAFDHFRPSTHPHRFRVSVCQIWMNWFADVLFSFLFVSYPRNSRHGENAPQGRYCQVSGLL